MDPGHINSRPGSSSHSFLPSQHRSQAATTRSMSHFRAHSHPAYSSRIHEWHASTMASSSPANNTEGQWSSGGNRRRWSVQATQSPMPSPSSPPPLIYEESPYANIPLPSQNDELPQVVLNPILEYRQHREPRIQFDVSQPPWSVSPRRCMMQPATDPLLPSLAIVSPLLPWPVVVHRSSVTPAGVMVADVVGALCSSMRMRLEEDKEDEEQEQENEEHVEWGTRPREVRQKEPPLTRLSLLRGQHKFMGLSRSEIGGDTWELHVR